MSRRRAVAISVVISYLFLLVIALVSDVVLANIFFSVLSRPTSMAPSIVERSLSGSVSGWYTLTYITRVVYQWIPGQGYVPLYVTISALLIQLVNTGPFDTQVVLIGYFGSDSTPVHLLDMASALGTVREEGKPYPVKWIFNPGWFPGAGKALYMPPGETITLTIPAYYGVPAKLLACTPVGCALLKPQGISESTPRPAIGWIIGSPPPPPIKITETWKFRLEEEDKETVVLPSTNSGTSKTKYGTVLSFSAVKGLPPTVVAGYYSTDPQFSFSVPPSISLLGGTYNLPSFDYSGKDEPLVPTEWLRWSDGFTQTISKKITIEADMRVEYTTPNPDGKPPTFSDIWKNSQYIFVYVAAKGYYSWWGNQHDTVTITVMYCDTTGELHVVGVLYADSGFKDNSADLNSNPLAWAIPADDAQEIKIGIVYTMTGKPPLSLNGVRPARLAFYVALIPQEWIS